MSSGRKTGGRLLGLTAATLAALVVGCTDAPFNLDWDHNYAEGLVIREDGVERVRVGKDGTVTGDLRIGAGQRSGRLDVVFLDGKGATLVHKDDEYMEVTVTFPDLATFEPSAPGAFSGRLLGLKAGKTSIYFKLKEGTLGSGKGIGPSSAIDLTISK